jgi:uncharacterized protein Yka (UPF0111/DUF47 family)
MKTLFKVEPISQWLDQVKGKERPAAEYHKSIRRTVSRVKSLPFKPEAIIRFNHKIDMEIHDCGKLVTASLEWLRDNAVGAFKHDVRGPRIFLALEQDAALFKLVFGDQA